MTESLTSRVEKATRQIESAAKVYTEVKCAGSNVMVDTGCGLVPSLRKVLNDLAGYQFRGEWSASTQYESKDQVKISDGSIWLCLSDHLAGSDFQADVASGHWVVWQAVVDSSSIGYQVAEMERQSNQDTLGRQLFYGDAYKVEHAAGTTYTLKPGTGYVAGIRLEGLGESAQVTQFPQSVWLDVSMQGEGQETIYPVIQVVVTDQLLSDYTDAKNYRHFLQKVADVREDEVIDKRRVPVEQKQVRCSTVDDARRGTYSGVERIIVTNLDDAPFEVVNSEKASISPASSVFKDAGDQWWRLVANDSVFVEWFGAIGDGNTDDGQAIQDAMDFAYITPSSAVLFKDRIYRCDRQLNPFGQQYTLTGSPRATIDFSFLDKSLFPEAIKIIASHPRGLKKYDPENTVSGVSARRRYQTVVMRNLAIEGKRDGYRGWRCSDSSYAHGVTAIDYHYGYNGGDFENVSVVGFEKGFNFGDHSYLVEFRTCSVNHSKWAVYFDATDKSDLGENLKWLGGVIGNCTYGIYNYLGGWWFSDMSIDYCEQAVVYNQTKLNGVSSGNITFTNCWFEVSAKNGEFDFDTPYIVNDSTMYFNNCMLWTESIGNILKVGNGEAFTVINDCMFRIRGSANEPIIDNEAKGTVVIKGQTYDSRADVMPLLFELSNFPEGIPIRGAVNEWEARDGTLTREDRGISHRPYKLRLKNSVQYKAATMRSAPFELTSRAMRLMIGYNSQNTSSSSHINAVEFYNSKGALIDSHKITLFSGGYWQKTTTGYIQVPAGAEYGRLFLGIGNTDDGEYLEFDFFYTENI